jgi:hypothetical protein
MYPRDVSLVGIFTIAETAGYVNAPMIGNSFPLPGKIYVVCYRRGHGKPKKADRNML